MIWTILRGYLWIAGVASVLFLYVAVVSHVIDCVRVGLKMRACRRRPAPPLRTDRDWLSIVVRLPVIQEDR